MWSATFTQDTESKSIGTVTATDDVTGVTHSRRVDTADKNDVTAFKQECRQAAKKHGDNRKDANDIAAAIAAKLNEA